MTVYAVGWAVFMLQFFFWCGVVRLASKSEKGGWLRVEFGYVYIYNNVGNKK
jgi:hypothetical protein